MFKSTDGGATWQPTTDVNLNPTTTSVTPSVNPSVLGQSVTFTATVAGMIQGEGIPTGTVTFFDGTASLGTGAFNSAGQAALITSSLAQGSHPITVQYGADTNFAGSTSTVVPQLVDMDPTTTTVASSQNPSVLGQSVTFTATVNTASGTPTGVVTFLDGTTSLGTGTLNSSAHATLQTSALNVSSHSITAQYGGDTNFAGSTSTAVSQVVNMASTTTVVVPSPNPSTAGQSVTLTATVSVIAPGAGTPTGAVTFFDGTTSLGSGTLNSSDVAVFATSALAVGSHSITANYGGDTNFTSNKSTVLSQVVNGKPSATALTSSLNPEVGGQSVTFTATVSSTAGGTPTGTVTFFDGSTALGTGAVTLNASAVATLSTTVLAVGSHSITASYSGDANYAASTSAAVSETVTTAGFAPSPTGLTVTAGQNLVINLTLYAAAGSGLNFTLSCVGAPSKTTCLFSPNPVAPGPPPNGTPVQLTLGTSSSRLPPGPSNRGPWP